MRLELETALARAAGHLSRAAGRGGGTTLPGKLLAAVDPGAVRALADRLDAGSIVISATNGKTTTAAMAAEVLAPRFRLAHNSAGANLVSGVASALIAARDAQLGLFEVDEAALPTVVQSVRPRVVALGNLFRDQLDRYGELELVAERWREAVGGLPAETWLVVNGDDPLVAHLARGRPQSITFGVDDHAAASGALQHAADSKYCVRCGTAYDYAAAYVGHLGEYACPACGHRRPPLDLAARAIDLDGVAVSFDLDAGGENRRVRLRVPGLHNVYNALAAAAATRALGLPLEEIVAGLEQARPAFGRFERIAMDGKTLLVLLIKNPAGANESVRTLLRSGGPELAVVALNDAIADGRDVSWIWDVDFEPLAAQLDRLIVSGERAAELALRFTYGGMEASAVEVIPDLAHALDRGLELTPPGAQLAFLPTYTAMLGLQRIIAERGHAKPYWER